MIRALIFGTALITMILCYGCGTEPTGPTPLGLCFYESEGKWSVEHDGCTCSIGLSAAECFESGGYEWQFSRPFVHGGYEVYCPW